MSDFSTQSRVGYVYVLTNPAMPGVVKIGRSRHGAASRAKSLSGTSVPTSFVVAFEILCLDAERAEERAHRYAEKSRIAANREFFEMPVRDAVGHVIDAAWKDWDRHGDDRREIGPVFEIDPLARCSKDVALANIASIRARLAEGAQG